MKMKRKKGFTLVELIVSISLLAIIGISIGVSLNKVNKNQNNNDKEVVISKIKSAADVYLSGNSTVLNSLYTDKAYVLIKVSDLISEGLIDKNLTDPTTGTAIADDATVMASLDETGTIKYDYPADPANEDYLKVLNVYLEQNEKADCFTGANGVGYVKG